jgi:hypothetical protein
MWIRLLATNTATAAASTGSARTNMDMAALRGGEVAILTPAM